MSAGKAAGEMAAQLRTEVEVLRVEHGDAIEEAYPDAGYCGCRDCQRLVPLLSDAAEIVGALKRERDAAVKALRDIAHRPGWPLDPRVACIEMQSRAREALREIAAPTPEHQP